MANIKEVASRVENLYFQDYAETSEFFDAGDFAFYCGAAYADLLGQEYRLEYNRMIAEGVSDIVGFSSDWLKTETLKRQTDKENGYYIDLSQPILSLPYDKQNSSIQNIYPADKKFKGEYIRGSVDNTWEDEYLPLTKKVFWSLLGNRIYLTTNMGEPPSLSKVVYVPGISDDLDIPDARVWAVITNTIEMMRKAAANYVVSETADQNSNKLPQTDVDKNLIK